MTNNDITENRGEPVLYPNESSSTNFPILERKYKVQAINILVSLAAGLIGAMLFIVLQNYIYGKTYGVIQLNKLLTQHIKEYSEKNTDKEKIDAVTAKYAVALEQSIKELESKNIVLLVDAAVITKLPDYTDYVKAEIDRKLESQ